jgi:hypothetical protein
MNKIRKCLLSVGLLLLPSLAYALPVNEFVDTLFIGGGVMLFASGVLLLLIPGLFKTGVITTLFADVLFIARMLFPDALEQTIAAQPDLQPWIESASTANGRVYAAVSVVIVVVSILSSRWLLHVIFEPTPTVKRTASTRQNTETRARSETKPARNKTRIVRDRDDFSGYTEEPEPEPIPEPVSPTSSKRFRVHDYLDNLEHQQPPTEAPSKQPAEPTIHFDRIER